MYANEHFRGGEVKEARERYLLQGNMCLTMLRKRSRQRRQQVTHIKQTRILIQDYREKQAKPGDAESEPNVLETRSMAGRVSILNRTRQRRRDDSFTRKDKTTNRIVG